MILMVYMLALLVFDLFSSLCESVVFILALHPCSSSVPFVHALVSTTFTKEYACLSYSVEVLPKIGTQSILLEIERKWRENKYNKIQQSTTG